MWQVVYIAVEEEVQEIKKKLLEKGFLVQIEELDKYNYQIKVPASEAEEVYELLNESL